MRADYKLPRLFVEHRISASGPIAMDRSQSNYLLNVLRLKDEDVVLVFNGIDGEWRARLEKQGRKDAALTPFEIARPQPGRPDLVYLFAPLKVGRMDYMVQKAVEMGAGFLQPVQTQHTQVPKINEDRLAANIREAAEQCGVLALPELRPMVKLDRLLQDWPRERRIVFCDEDAGSDAPLAILSNVATGPMAVLIGPEGGFSDDERQMLRALPFVTAIPLGPRILRADTAAVAALALVQATLGDWRHNMDGDN